MVFFSMGKEGAPAVWNMPTENHRFVGRDDIIEEIKMQLNAQQQEVVVIRGPQGFGKTQIAKRFVYKNFQKYDVVWWFKANQYLQPHFLLSKTKSFTPEGVVSRTKNKWSRIRSKTHRYSYVP